MLDWLEAIPNLGVRGVRGVPPQKSATSGECSGVPTGVRGVPEHPARTPRTPDGTPTRVAKPLENKREHPEHLEHHEKGQVAGVLRFWRDRLMRLSPVKPLHGYSRNRWGLLLDDADFVFDQFGEIAARVGFDAFDLFGCLPGRDGWGGIAERLRGSRSLVFGGEVATWRRVVNGSPETFPRGFGERSGFTLLWESA